MGKAFSLMGITFCTAIPEMEQISYVNNSIHTKLKNTERP
jgi:hypothetical protein